MINSKIKFKYFFALLILLNALSVIYQPLNRLYIYIIMPFMSVYAFIIDPTSLFKNKLFKWYTAFTLGFIFISIFGENLLNSIYNIPFFINTYFVVSVTTAFSNNPRYIKIFILYYLFYFISCWILGYTQYGFADIDITQDRVGGDGLNANRFGYFIFFLVFICYLLGDLSKRKKLWKFIFLISPIVSFYVSLLTGSRQVLVIMLPFTLFLFGLRYFRKITLKNIIVYILVLSLLLAIFPKIYDIYSSSYLSERVSENITEDSRIMLINDAINIAIENPLTGIGLGNLEFLSHCSYSDAMAEGGFIIFIIFSGMLIYFCNIQIKRYRKTKNPIFIAFLIFGIFYIFYNLFFVFYLFAIVMAYLFLAEQYSKHIYYKIIEKNAYSIM